MPDPPENAPIAEVDTTLIDGEAMEVCAEHRTVQPSRAGDAGMYSYTGEIVIVCRYEYDTFLPIVIKP